MLFSSISFLYYFLPCVLILYLVTPRKFKNFVLLLSSLFFYGWGGVNFLWLMMIMLAAGYIWGLLVGKYREQKIGKWLLGAALGMNVLTLIYFKFADVFPIGISFYTFQNMSYVIDVYRGDTQVQRNVASYATYLCLFPQLIAGPIVRYSDVNRELRSRTITVEQISYGVLRFAAGLGKKVLLANTLGQLAEMTVTEGSVVFSWLRAIAYALQIYFDFSGYSDMAIGMGAMMGFVFLENFNYPYLSRSVTEFWRRWHMSLGGWFRDYVYIPLGGNRVSKGQ